MKLVMVYYCTDGCTYGYDIMIPFEYESAESAIVDFQTVLNNSSYMESFSFAGRSGYEKYNFENADGNIELPDIFTLEEWFEKYS